MKLENFFNRIRPRFGPGQKLRPLHPLFSAIEHFFLWADSTAPNAPHARDPVDVKRFMSMVILALIPCTLMGWYLFGPRVLAIIAVSYAVGGMFEVLFACIRREEINEGFLVTGLIFPLTLPPTTPLWMVAVGIAFGVVVGKELFGGTGRNLFNPALVGRCFLALAYPSAMTRFWIEPGHGTFGRLTQWVGNIPFAGALNTDAITSATPLGLARLGEYTDSWNLLIGNITGSIGETSVIAIALGAVFLLATRVINFRPLVGMLGSYIILGLILNGLGLPQFPPTSWHMLAGSLLFGAVFMATDPVTAPGSNPARWMYGILIGVATLLIRNLTVYVEGVMFAILLGNVFAPVLDDLVIGRYKRRWRNEA